MTEKLSVLEPARLDINNISINYDSLKAIEDLSFSVNHGQRVAVIGPNGAGTVSYTHLTLPTTPYV